jgi:hypothetical protein
MTLTSWPLATGVLTAVMVWAMIVILILLLASWLALDNYQ